MLEGKFFNHPSNFPASQLLRIEMKPAQIQELVRNVDKDHTGEIELGEFIEMMSEQLGRVRTGRAEGGNVRVDNSSAASLLSLDVSILGYRRAKLLKALEEQGKETLKGWFS